MDSRTKFLVKPWSQNERKSETKWCDQRLHHAVILYQILSNKVAGTPEMLKHFSVFLRKKSAGEGVRTLVGTKPADF